MKRRIRTATWSRHAARVPALCGALLCAIALPATAASPSEEGMGQGSEKAMKPSLPEAYKLSNWIGKPVIGPEGEKLGKVEELVMDDYGVLRYLILQRPEAGPGDSPMMVAVPIGHFLYPMGEDGKAQHLVLAASADQLKEAPAFGAAHWPNMGDEQWRMLVIQYWLPEQAEMEQAQRGAEGMQPFQANRDMVYLSEERAKLFSELDKDEDAAIEREEAKANERVAKQFDALDTYDNDRITRSEFSMFEVREE